MPSSSKGETIFYLERRSELSDSFCCSYADLEGAGVRFQRTLRTSSVITCRTKSDVVTFERLDPRTIHQSERVRPP